MRHRLPALVLLLVGLALGAALAPRPALGGAFAPAPRDWVNLTKTTDQTRTSTTSLANDSDLVFSAAANTKYRFRMSVWITSDGDADFKWGLTGPSSPTVFLCQYQRGAATTYSWDAAMRTSYPSGVTIIDGGTTAFNGWVWCEGVLHNGVNAATFGLQWAQDASSVDGATVRAGSWLEYKVVQ